MRLFLRSGNATIQQIDVALDRKAKEKYGGPYVVISRHANGNYTLGELDGAVSATSYAPSRLLPYFPRTQVPTHEMAFDHPAWTDDAEAYEDVVAAGDPSTEGLLSDTEESLSGTE